MSNSYIKMDPLNDNSELKVGLWDVNGLSEEKSKKDFFLKKNSVV